MSPAYQEDFLLALAVVLDEEMEAYALAVTRNAMTEQAEEKEQGEGEEEQAEEEQEAAGATLRGMRATLCWREQVQLARSSAPFTSNLLYIMRTTTAQRDARARLNTRPSTFGPGRYSVSQEAVDWSRVCWELSRMVQRRESIARVSECEKSVLPIMARWDVVVCSLGRSNQRLLHSMDMCGISRDLKSLSSVFDQALCELDEEAMQQFKQRLDIEPNGAIAIMLDNVNFNGRCAGSGSRTVATLTVMLRHLRDTHGPALQQKLVTCQKLWQQYHGLEGEEEKTAFRKANKTELTLHCPCFREARVRELLYAFAANAGWEHVEPGTGTTTAGTENEEDQSDDHASASAASSASTPPSPPPSPPPAFIFGDTFCPEHLRGADLQNNEESISSEHVMQALQHPEARHTQWQLLDALAGCSSGRLADCRDIILKYITNVTTSCSDQKIPALLPCDIEVIMCLIKTAAGREEYAHLIWLPAFWHSQQHMFKICIAEESTDKCYPLISRFFMLISEWMDLQAHRKRYRKLSKLLQSDRSALFQTMNRAFQILRDDEAWNRTKEKQKGMWDVMVGSREQQTDSSNWRELLEDEEFVHGRHVTSKVLHHVLHFLAFVLPKLVTPYDRAVLLRDLREMWEWYLWAFLVLMGTPAGASPQALYPPYFAVMIDNLDFLREHNPDALKLVGNHALSFMEIHVEFENARRERVASTAGNRGISNTDRSADTVKKAVSLLNTAKQSREDLLDHLDNDEDYLTNPHPNKKHARLFEAVSSHLKRSDDPDAHTAEQERQKILEKRVAIYMEYMLSYTLDVDGVGEPAILNAAYRGYMNVNAWSHKLDLLTKNMDKHGNIADLRVADFERNIDEF